MECNTLSIFFVYFAHNYSITILNKIPMYGKMKDHLSKTIAEIRDAGLYKEERLIESPQRAAITVSVDSNGKYRYQDYDKIE